VQLNLDVGPSGKFALLSHRHSFRIPNRSLHVKWCGHSPMVPSVPALREVPTVSTCSYSGRTSSRGLR
jgi:hypothetical protein